MEGALAWIGQLAEWLGSLFPRLKICRSTHQGVKFVRGAKVKVIQPGIFLYWPIVTDVELYPVKRQTLNLVTQTLTTKDDEAIIFSIIVIYHVEDIEKALCDCWDIEDTITDIALQASVDVVAAHDFAQIRAGISKGIATAITLKCRALLRPFGIYVEKCGVTDFAQTKVYRLVGEGGEQKRASAVVWSE